MSDGGGGASNGDGAASHVRFADGVADDGGSTTRRRKQDDRGSNLMLSAKLSLYPINRKLEAHQRDKEAPVNPVVAAVKYVTPLFPPQKWAARYSKQDLTGDLMAGITVGLMVVPQALAYAVIADLPYEYGLFSSFMGAFVYCAFGTSRDVSVGPTAIISLLVAVEAEGDPVKAATLALLSGLVQMAVGMLKFGAVFDLVSPPVLAGFVSASAITIATGQLKDLLGLSGRGIGREFTHALSGVVENLEHTSVNDLLLGLGSMIMVYLLQQLKNRKGKNSWLASGLGTARNAVVVVLATVVALVAKVSMGDDDFNARHPFVLIGDMPAGLPEPAVPELDLSLLTSSCVLAIVGFLESFSIASSFGRKNGYPVAANQELFALGAANSISSFFRSYPITGSFSRSSVNAASGVRTPLAGVATGLIVMLSLMLLTPVFFYVPKAALAAVIIMSVVRMVEWHEVPRLWAHDREDLVVAVVSFLLCLLINTEYGIIAGATIAVSFLLYHTARPRYSVVRGGGFSRAVDPRRGLHPQMAPITSDGEVDADGNGAGLDAGGVAGTGAGVEAAPGGASGVASGVPSTEMASPARSHGNYDISEDGEVLVTTPFQVQPGATTTKAVIVKGGWGNQRRVLIPLGTMVFTLRGPLVAACTTHFTQALQDELNIVRGQLRPRYFSQDAAQRAPRGAAAADTGAAAPVAETAPQAGATATAVVGGGDLAPAGRTPQPLMPDSERVVDVQLSEYKSGGIGFANLILDLACVPWIDSAGLTALETVIKAAYDGVYNGGAADAPKADKRPPMKVYLTTISPGVWTQLRRSHILFTLVPRAHCCPTVRGAVAHIRGTDGRLGHAHELPGEAFSQRDHVAAEVAGREGGSAVGSGDVAVDVRQ